MDRSIRRLGGFMILLFCALFVQLNYIQVFRADDLNIKTRMKSQSDGINDDWARRYSEIRLGTEFDLVPAVPSLS